MRRLSIIVLAIGCSSAPKSDPVDLFNGKDLAGWVRVNCAPETFRVEDGVIITTGRPTGVMRTERMYENYILEMDWRHMKKGGNAGLFVHSGALPVLGQPFTKGHEIQVLDGDSPDGSWTGHGDVFSIHGATFEPDRKHPKGWMRCLPSEKRANPFGQWNHYRVTVNDGTIKLEVNGKEVSGGSKCVPRKGYICLESEGSECHFKNIRIQELPSTNPGPMDVAEADPGFVPLYSGLDLRGWKVDPANDGHWNPKNWVLDYDGKGKDLWSEKSYGDFILQVDWKFTRKPEEKELPEVLANGDDSGKKVKVPDAGDSGIYLRGSSKSQVNIWCWPIGSGEVYGYRTDKAQPAEVRAGATPKVNADHKPGQWNRFLMSMKGDRLTVVLNGKTVLENAQLPGVAPRGPIALQNHGDPIQFTNIFIKELN